MTGKESIDTEKVNMTPVKYKKQNIEKVWVDRNTGKELYTEEQVRKHCREKVREFKEARE